VDEHLVGIFFAQSASQGFSWVPPVAKGMNWSSSWPPRGRIPEGRQTRCLESSGGWAQSRRRSPPSPLPSTPGFSRRAFQILTERVSAFLRLLKIDRVPRLIVRPVVIVVALFAGRRIFVDHSFLEPFLKTVLIAEERLILGQYFVEGIFLSRSSLRWSVSMKVRLMVSFKPSSLQKPSPSASSMIISRSGSC